jgi:hypothetical protein
MSPIYSYFLLMDILTSIQFARHPELYRFQRMIWDSHELKTLNTPCSCSAPVTPAARRMRGAENALNEPGCGKERDRHGGHDQPGCGVGISQIDDDVKKLRQTVGPQK